MGQWELCSWMTGRERHRVVIPTAHAMPCWRQESRYELQLWAAGVTGGNRDRLAVAETKGPRHVEARLATWAQRHLPAP